MALPTNIFQAVQTYQKSELAFLQNMSCFISTANTKFKDFNTLTANLGSTVTFDLPPRFATADTLVATFQPSQQRVQSLTVDQSKNVSMDYTNQQWIFNLEPMDYMQQFGKAAVKQLATTVEAQVARNTIINSAYRFYGNGVTPINSVGQLSTMLAFYRNYGDPEGELKGYLYDLAIPGIINTMLNQFVIDRNEEIAMSWMLGKFDGCDWYRSNLLPKHTAGTVGDTAAPGNVLTVVNTNDPTGANITQITLSGATASDVNAIKNGDLMQFNFGVSGQPDQYYLTFIGQQLSGNPVQIRATADAIATGGGNVTVSIFPALSSTPGQNQNIVYNVVAGMTLTVMPSHRRGLIVGGNALYLAMPRLPDEAPFPTINDSDPDTGVALRIYYGSLFGQNQRGIVHDIIWGSTAVPEYCMAILFPLI